MKVFVTKATLAGVVGLILFGNAANAHAELLTDWGVTASTAVADTPSFSTNFEFGPFGGGQGETTAASSIAVSRGTAQAEGSFAGPAGTPILKAKGSSIIGRKGAFGDVFASQGYTYDGPATTLTLSATLTGTLSDPAAASAGRIRGRVAIFEVENYSFSGDYASLVFEAGATVRDQTGEGGDALMTFTLDNTGAISSTQSVVFDVVPGDQFYIWTDLDAGAVSSNTEVGLADAFNTLTMSFSSAAGLTPTSIPEPSALLLLVAASGITLLARRR